MMDTFSCNSSCEQKQAPFEHHDDVDIDDHDDHQEESGWTTYLDDFANQYITTQHEESDHQDKSSCSLLGVSPSLVSDAATDAFSGRSAPVNFPSKLKFGRARTKKICEDDSLEDTASSPVNSPKVSQFEHIQTPPRKIEDYVSSSFVMRNVRGMGDHQIQNQEGEEQRLTMMRREGNNNNNMDLRSRGLCVVPISMLANYNGRF
ncbi:Vascular-related protein 1 [Cardamine amara subsp. amara]|uniref:Vascular-related protein 1 n=1 Tax=Cardamine amara subsp. amara TaxID=228776 RepID=A0ABD0ZSA0_CARAN